MADDRTEDTNGQAQRRKPKVAIVCSCMHRVTAVTEPAALEAMADHRNFFGSDGGVCLGRTQ